MNGGAAFLQALGAGLPNASDLPLKRAARLVTNENPYISEKVRVDLGWRPPFTHEAGIAATTEWMLNTGQ